MSSVKIFQVQTRLTTEEFGQYLTYVRNLKFEEQPDYDMCRDLMDKGTAVLMQALLGQNQIDDGIFDWMPELDERRVKREVAREREKEKELGRIGETQEVLHTDTTTPTSNFPAQRQSTPFSPNTVNGMHGSSRRPSNNPEVPKEEAEVPVVVESIAPPQLTQSGLVTKDEALQTPKPAAAPLKKKGKFSFRRIFKCLLPKAN